MCIYIYFYCFISFFLLISLIFRQSESGISLDYLRNLSKFQNEWVERERAKGVPVFSSTSFFQATSLQGLEKQNATAMGANAKVGGEESDRLVDGVMDFILHLK